MSEQRTQHEAWKAARRRLNGKIVELVPPTSDPASDVMDIIVAAVANSLSIPAKEITRGISLPDTISARKLAMAMCVRHPRFSAERVAEYFEVGEITVQKAVASLDPILDSYCITRKTPLELSMPLIAKEWMATEHVRRRRPSLESILNAASEVFDQSVEDIISGRRDRFILPARITAIGLCRHLTSQSYPEIGKFFGGRDHTTIMHCVRKFAPVFEEIRNRISPAATPTMWATMAEQQMRVTKLGKGLKW